MKAVGVVPAMAMCAYFTREALAESNGVCNKGLLLPVCHSEGAFFGDVFSILRTVPKKNAARYSCRQASVPYATGTVPCVNASPSAEPALSEVEWGRLE